MVGIPGEHALERLDDLLGARLGLAVERPEAPRPQVHHGVGEEGGGLQVIGERARRLSHGVRVRAVEVRARGAGVRRMAPRERLDQRPLGGAGAGCEPRRLLDRRQRPLLALGVGGAVVVRALGQRDAPVAHGTRRIDASPLPERLLGLLVVEGVHEPEALVEPALGLRGRRRDPMGVAPQRVVADRALRTSVALVRHLGPLGRAGGQREDQGGTKIQRPWRHRNCPPLSNCDMQRPARGCT